MKKEELILGVKKILKSKVFKAVIYLLGFIIVASFIFRAGVYAGLEKASFGRDWGDNYSKNFGMMPRGPKMMMDNFDNLPNPHGAIGRIIKNNESSVVVLDDKDKIEKVILINDNTEIRKMRESISIGDLEIDTFIVVIGQPNSDGQIEAKLIRVMPSPDDMDSIKNKFNR